MTPPLPPPPSGFATVDRPNFIIEEKSETLAQEEKLGPSHGTGRLAPSAFFTQ